MLCVLVSVEVPFKAFPFAVISLVFIMSVHFEFSLIL